MWYLPVTDRLRAIFGNPDDAKLMSWHASADRLKDDGKLRHPSDGKQWKDFDEANPEFGKEPRHVRFALSTDGMNPFGELSSSHSTKYRSRQRYKEGIFQKGYDQGVAEMISRSIKEAFTSNDPDMVSMRS